VVAGLLGLLGSGCAAIPSSGTPQSTPTPPPLGGGGAPDCCRTILRGPQPGWTAAQVVKGFLVASASVAHDHALARQYLTKDANKAWQPQNAVTILTSAPAVSPLRGRVTSPGGKVAVLVTGQPLATLNDNGQYIPTAGGATKADFTLELVNGRLLIDGLPGAGTPAKPSHQLLLASDLFHLVYTPRNLYYYGMGTGSLVPDPVFVPAEDTNPAAKLINDLRHDPNGLLQNAARTAFPPGTQLEKPLQILPSPSGGKIAIVSMKVPRSVTSQEKQAMATQLAATLTSSAYSPALFQAVKFKINGKFWAPSHDPLLDLRSVSGNIPHPRGDEALYYLTSSGSPRMLGSQSTRGAALPGGQAALNDIAVAPGGRYLAAVAAPASTIYTSSLGGSDAKTGGHSAELHLRRQLSGSSFTSMSWDNQKDLWVAGRLRHSPGVWVLPSGEAPALRVPLPKTVRGPVTGIRVAPDGSRVAMIIGSGASARLVLGAVVRDGASYFVLRSVPLGAGLTGVTSLTWYDEDHLLALAVTQTKSGPQSSLWGVPANGDSARLLTGQGDSVAITAAGPQNPLYLSLSTGQVEKSVGLDEPWTYIAAGRAATYPG
jgi:hypothetical protein